MVKKNECGRGDTWYRSMYSMLHFSSNINVLVMEHDGETRCI